MISKNKRPRDLAQLAKSIVDDATSDTPIESENEPTKNEHAVALGKLGGKKCGPERAAAPSPERRKKEIARNADHTSRQSMPRSRTRSTTPHLPSCTAKTTRIPGTVRPSSSESRRKS